ncbi:MAG TPA: shikimate kinase [Jiangellales bacterium]|nr:shikimate kinase [Jiangellales bacterium]
MSPKLVIVGPPGAGKTTIGRLVADRLGGELRDTDTDVERLAGKPISEIFIDDGEAVFRSLERAAVAAAIAEHDGVVALGGGAVLDERTRALLDSLRVVFLDVGLADAAARVGLNRDRPLLIGNPRAQLNRLMNERRPLYVDVATITVDTSGRTPQDVADEVLRHVG